MRGGRMVRRARLMTPPPRKLPVKRINDRRRVLTDELLLEVQQRRIVEIAQPAVVGSTFQCAQVLVR